MKIQTIVLSVLLSTIAMTTRAEVARTTIDPRTAALDANLRLLDSLTGGNSPNRLGPQAFNLYCWAAGFNCALGHQRSCDLYRKYCQ